MARIRSVHPGLLTDENFMALTVSNPLAAVFLIGLWTEADDQGVFEWKPLTLKARVLPAVAQPVDALLKALVENSFIMCFSTGGRSYGAVRNFCRFQHPKKPNNIHPKTPEILHYVGIEGRSGAPNSEPVGDQFGTGGEKVSLMEEEKKKEEKKEKNIRQDGKAVPRPEGSPEIDAGQPNLEKPSKPLKADKRGTRVDPDWKPSTEDRAFAASVGVPERDIERHAAEFRDYWAGVGGTKGVKLNWAATWRNRCRQIAEHKGYRPPASASISAGVPERPSGWPSGVPDPERLFAIWVAGKWSQAAWGFPPGDPSCRIPQAIVDEWQQRRQEAA